MEYCVYRGKDIIAQIGAPLNRRNTSFQGGCKEKRDWESGIRIGDRGISGRGSHVGRWTKLWEIKGEKQKSVRRLEIV